MLQLLGLLVFLACVCHLRADKVEKEVEEVIRRAILLDFSIYDRNEPYALTIINQDGYRICSGTIDRNQLKPVDCPVKKEQLKHGDNTFYITIYSKKTKSIISETTTGYHYDHSPLYGIVGKIAEAATKAKDSLTCTLMHSDECGVTPRELLTNNNSSLTMRAMGLGSMLTAGVYAAYVRPAILRSCVNALKGAWSKLRSLFVQLPPGPPMLIEGSPGNDDEGSFPPTGAPPKPVSSSTHMQVDAPRSASQKAFRARSTRLVGLLVGAALLSPAVFRPALQQVRTSFATHQQVRTSCWYSADWVARWPVYSHAAGDRADSSSV